MKIFQYILLVILFTSCAALGGKPKGVIPDDKLVNVLVDIHFADAVISIKGYRVSKDSAAIHKFYDDVLKKHNVSRKAFKTSIDYYSKNAAEYDRLYEQVLEELSKKQKQFNEEELKTPNANKSKS